MFLWRYLWIITHLCTEELMFPLLSVVVVPFSCVFEESGLRSTSWLAGGILLLGHPLAEQHSVFQVGSRAACVSVPSPVQPFLLDHCMDFLEGGAGRSGHLWVHLSLLWGSHLAFVPSLLDCWTNTHSLSSDLSPLLPSACPSHSFGDSGVAWQCPLSVWNDYGRLLM